MAEEIKLMKGNEAIAHAAIRYGVDGYFGYPITPQSEILETLMAEMHGKQPEWSYYKLKVKWQPSIWYMEVQVQVNA